VSVELYVEDDAIAAIRKLAPESADGRETGGILLGRGPAPDGVIVVEQAGDPGPEAVRRPDFFLRDRGHAQNLADAAWADRQAVWVGDWHTHPMGGPSPSQRDLRTYAGLLAAAELAFEIFVSIIVVPDETLGWRQPRLHPWVFAVPRRAEPSRLSRRPG
jgi:integrative and conjugative element protein (TIGR02256 family)